MPNLSKKEYWNSIYEPDAPEEKKPSLLTRCKLFVKKILGQKILAYMRSYEDFFLWEVIFKKYLPQAKGARVLEIGSAPGRQLVRLNKTFGFIPYGVEYSESGVEINKRLFAANNLNPDNVIYADFLSGAFHRLYRGSFDLVISKGFIEHFTDVRHIIDRHINLLKDGGCLIISIPNLRGFNYFLTRIFHRELIPMHNLEIMRLEVFKGLFGQERLLPLYCNYYGTFSFGLFNTKKNSPMGIILNLCNRLQLILNVVFRLLFKDRGAESSWFSPGLIFIGIKKEAG